LTGCAPELPSITLRRLGREILYRIDRDRPAPNEPESAHPDNDAHITVKPSDRVRVVAEFEPVTGALLTSMVSALTTPAPTPTDDGEPDRRIPGQRTGDALADIIHRCANAGHAARGRRTETARPGHRVAGRPPREARPRDSGDRHPRRDPQPHREPGSEAGLRRAHHPRGVGFPLRTHGRRSDHPDGARGDAQGGDLPGPRRCLPRMRSTSAMVRRPSCRSLAGRGTNQPGESRAAVPTAPYVDPPLRLADDHGRRRKYPSSSTPVHKSGATTQG
jgi:hypothetical protein